MWLALPSPDAALNPSHYSQMLPFSVRGQYAAPEMRLKPPRKQGAPCPALEKAFARKVPRRTKAGSLT